MPDEKEPTQKYALILITGVVSLAVGVASALITNYLTKERLGITYSITTAKFADAAGQKVGIIAVRVTNTGRKEIENLQGQIELENAQLTRHQHEGMLASSIKSTASENRLAFEMPFLNSDESFSVQLLVEPKNDQLQSPRVELRGKGVIGKQATPDDLNRDAKTSALSTVVAPLSTMLATLSMFYLLSSRRASIMNRGEQRDEFAYLLALNGFGSEADRLRESSRDYSYWALSDSFTEGILIANSDDEILKRGVTVLRQTLEYAESIAPRSKAIINLNAARLAIKANDSKLAAELLASAEKDHSSEVRHRLQIDNELRQFHTKTDKS
jgi:hypothetical protein